MSKIEQAELLTFLKNAYVGKKLYEKYCIEADKKYSLSICEGEVLMNLHLSGGEGIARDMVEQGWISKSQVSKAVEKLVDCGYISSAEDKADRRLVRLRLTSKAAEPIKDLEAATDSFLDKMFAELSEDDISIFNALLQKMTDNVRGGQNK